MLRYAAGIVIDRLCISAMCLVMAANLAACPATGSNPPPPNFIIILADDLGYADVGCYWQPNDEAGHEKIETPNIDRMAEEGVRFTNFYMASSVCSPARAALMTGCYPPRVGLSDLEDRGVMRPRSRSGLNAEETTIAEALRAHGYATACIGKWHLGHRDPFLPTRHGFDYYYGLMFRHPDGNRLMRNETVIDTVGDDVLTSLYTNEAVRFITENKDRPFFIYLPHSMPHVPLGATEAFLGHSRRGLYGDVVSELDHSTGRILATLEELNLDERTVVIFTSDNGPELNYGNHGGKAFPLRGGKGKVWEGGFRVPFIARWPGHVKAGLVSHEMATAMDLLPTLCEMAGAELETAGPIDGRDIWPLFSDSTATSPHVVFYYYYMDRLLAIRKGKWKMQLFDDNEEHPSIVNAKPIALYNLNQDPGETRNVIWDHPDVAERLNRAANPMRTELGDKLTGWPGTSRRPAGFVD